MQMNIRLALLLIQSFPIFRGLSDLGGVHMAPCSYTTNTFGCPPYVQNFNGVFILLYHKMFSFLEVGMGGCPYIWMSPICSEFLIGYLFCYIIKCFPTLEVGMRGYQN